MSALRVNWFTEAAVVDLTNSAEGNAKLTISLKVKKKEDDVGWVGF